MKKQLILLMLASAALPGCVSIPKERLSFDIDKAELSEHVHFLAQPALKGRKPRSWESTTVRQYLKDRFAAYGLQPWAKCKGYEQPFGLGTNVIGILPGSDPNLVDEIIILAAHYDHIGKNKCGMHLGACDNASGVAALLEIAEQMALAEQRPRRPVCFASFDCEEKMAFGSFAFTCRDDFEKSKIAAVVNIDLLGRDFLELVPDSLFVVGTERYPELREEIVRFGEHMDIRILPVSTDIVGPRGDHVAFESLAIPVLFFTCGIYEDYHKPTDTAEKLDYSDVQSAAKVIARAVEHLSNSNTMPQPLPSNTPDKEQLRTFRRILRHITDPNQKKLELKKDTLEKLQQLSEETDRLILKEQYSLKDEKKYFRQALHTFIPVLAKQDLMFAGDNNDVLAIYESFVSQKKNLYEAYRSLVKHTLEHRGILSFGKAFKYQIYDLADDEYYLARMDDDRYQLDMIVTKLGISAQKRGLAFNIRVHPFHIIGNKDEFVDMCLLGWQIDKTDTSFAKIWNRTLKEICEQDYGSDYKSWLKWQLDKYRMKDQNQWLTSLRRSTNKRLAERALSASGQITQRQLRQIITDTNSPPSEKAWAIRSLAKRTGERSLLLIAELLDDETELPAEPNLPYFMQDNYPFAEHPDIRFLRKYWQENKAQEKQQPATVADVALQKLIELTGRDFGKDQHAWRKWIKRNVR